MTMEAQLPEPQDPEELLEQAASGLATSFAALDEIVSS